MKTLRNHYICLIVLALITRLIFFYLLSPWEKDVQNNYLLTSDGLSYHQLATSILFNANFEKDGKPECLITPAFPLYLAIIYKIFGINPIPVLLINILLDVVIVIIYFKYLITITTKLIALISASIFAIDPFIVLYTNSLMSETLFIFNISLSSFFFVKYFKSKQIYQLILVGFFWGLASLTRPIFQFFPLYCSLIYLILAKFSKSAAFNVILCMVVYFLTLSPWLYRNFKEFDVFQLSTSGSFNLIALHLTSLEMDRQNSDRLFIQKQIFEQADSLAEAEGERVGRLNDFKKAKYWNILAKKYIFRNPIKYLRYQALGISHLFLTLNTTVFSAALNPENSSKMIDIKRQVSFRESVASIWKNRTSFEKKIGILLLGYLAITYFFVIIGLVRFSNLPQEYLFLSITIMVYFIIVTGGAGLARFRLSMMQFYLPFCASAISLLFKNNKSIY